MPSYLVFQPGTSIADPPTGTAQPPPQVPGPIDALAANIEDWLSLELPRFLSGNAVKIGAVAVKPNSLQLSPVAILNGYPSSTIFMFQPAAITVTQAITRTTTSIVISAGSLTGLLYIGTPARGEFVKIENSIGGQNYGYEVDRGVGDTIPLQHDVGTEVWRCSSQFLWQSPTLSTGRPYSIKLESLTSTSRRSSDRTSVHNVRENRERHNLPICPANIRVGGQHLPASVSGNIVVTYRVRQKGAELDWYNSSTAQTPEMGVKVNLLITTSTGNVGTKIERTDTPTTADGTVTVTSADVRAAAGDVGSTTVNLTVWAMMDVTDVGTVNSRSQWQHTFMWTETPGGTPTGWHYDWGRNWGR